MEAKSRTHTESATGRSQWEHPAQFPPGPAAPIDAQPPVVPHTTGHTKRRQYASGQTQAYYGTSEPAAYGDPSYGSGQAPPSQGGQLFTPGLVAEGGFQAQQQTYFAPQEGGYQNGQYPQQQPVLAPAGQQQMGQMTNQFAQMGLQPGAAGGQKPVSIISVYLAHRLTIYHSSRFIPSTYLPRSPTPVNYTDPHLRSASLPT